ncbi:MAG TPA: DUF4038 domain-containing protein [Sulfurovum sp.]|nr:DUF4038 domain-containing protein [Sulfurovum sp.]
MNKHIKTINAVFVASTLLFLSACGTSIKSNTPNTPNNLINSNKIGKLTISSDKRMLQHEDGTGFFWMGDTAWEMSVDVTDAEVKFYMEDRKAKGFTVIQVSALPTRYDNGQFKENTDGAFPFSKDARTQPNFKQANEAYWKHIDYIVESAKNNNLYVALLPTWSGGLKNEDEAKTYGAFIADRYKDKENIIWVVGGDDSKEAETKHIWNALGNAINEKVTKQLISYHPPGNSSSTKLFKNASWLDFHMIQSGHCESIVNVTKLLKGAYANTGNKPVLDAEPRYEEIVRCFGKSNPDETDRITKDEVREIAYRQLFTGAFGHTYGHHAVWQMHETGDESKIGGSVHGDKDWKSALDDEGARQMTYVVNLMRSRPLLNRIPDQSMIQSGNALATRGVGYAFLYLPKGGSVTVNLGKISGDKVKAWRYDPRTGEASEIGTYPNTGTQNFSTGNEDMVLILDDVSKEYDTPGQL